jgi:hypothetical protein
MTAPRSRLMWAVMRDGEIHVTAKTRKVARETAAFFRRGILRSCSKHKWSTCRVRVTPIKNRKRRR